MNSLNFIHLSKVTQYALVACGMLALVFLVPTQSAHASSYVVTNTNDSNAGSLRQAILDANQNPGADTITFAIGTGAQSIKPASGLPQITDAVTIDGTSQPSYAGTPLIELNGASAGFGAIGFDLAANHCTIQGLVINRFSGNGIRLTGSNNLITHNYIGTDLSGTVAYGNGTYGVVQFAALYVNGTTSSADNVIRENVVSGNQYVGILVQGEANATKIQGNKIGTTPDGHTNLGNGDNGIQIGPGGADTLIGGTNPGEGNLVSGNGWHGIVVNQTTGTTLVQGNLVGTDVTGAQAMGNYQVGVWTGSMNVTIGGTISAARNVIAANALGIYSGNSPGVTVQGNFIGVNSAGTDKLGNSAGGIFVDQGTTNAVIGGTDAGAGNVISGNGGNGITNNFNTSMAVQGNLIGTNASGNACLGNVWEGIFLADGATIGGIAQSAGNVISCNGSDGIEVCGDTACPEAWSASHSNQGVDIKSIPLLNSPLNPAKQNPDSGMANETLQPRTDNSATTPSQTATTFATIGNNYIGTDETGTLNLGNAEEGIVLWYIDGNQITDNVVAFNPKYGINVASGSANTIQHNSIRSSENGVNVSGTGNTILDNTISNSTYYGVVVWSTDNLIQDNTVSENGWSGVAVANGSTIVGNNTVKHNTIVSNGEHGVQFSGPGNSLVENTISDSAQNGVYVIASANLVQDNIITTNGNAGVLIGKGSGNELRGNSISANGALGIDLAPEGVTPNDVGDKDKGANKTQNFPVLTAASAKTGKIKGTLNSIPNKSFAIEFFTIEKCDSSHNGEGNLLLGFKTVKADSTGNITFSYKAAGLVAGQFVTATATDSKGNTSEFSKCIKIK